ncbi:PRAME family member 12-like [Pipistrellus kuhlii]|uniref:PRAME family member 12-like n=1 Tax=Pipistrellus kuhlii TaxID=59472 RepID=UPI00174F67D0|nr:PRAME family member 12-like [Pipistrellus kuhlii]
MALLFVWAKPVTAGFLWSTLRMSMRAPPTLLQLAAESLVKDQASAIAALEYLPAELFPQLFLQAYLGRHYSVLTAITKAWPFAVLPLGSLNDLPPVDVLKAVLNGLDVLLAQEVRPRRCKLRVLDLRYMDSDFWTIWCGDNIQEYSSIFPVTEHRSSPNMEHPLAPMEVFLDLNFNINNRTKVSMYVIQWAQQRKELLHLCCRKLWVAGVLFHRARKFLDVVQLDCIQQVKLNCTWHLTTLEMFALYIGQMKNLQKLYLFHIQVLGEEGEEEEDEEQDLEEEEEMDWEEEWAGEEQEEQISFSQFFSQMLSPLHLRELVLDSLSFLQGRLHQMLSCLQFPLEILIIKHCGPLTHSDLEHLFQCPKLRQLKSLRLYCASLADFSPEPLRSLLEALAPTLQVLHLENCAMVDSQVEAILPVLSHCHQLREFTIIKNHLSVATMEKLLHHTAGLRSLEIEHYPVPQECYTAQDTVDQDRLALVRAELKGILRELGQPRTIKLATDRDSIEFYDVEFS